MNDRGREIMCAWDRERDRERLIVKERGNDQVKGERERNKKGR